MDLVWNLKLYVVALTKETRNAASAVYTAEALGAWAFNGTGSINAGANYAWTGIGHGVTAPATWAAVNDGTRPITDTDRFNFAINKKQTWIPVP